MRESQYGFRPGRGTGDALFLVRRLIDATIEDKNGRLLILLLDWSKAFDRVRSDSLLTALKRFGVPSHMLDMIGAIYAQRTFDVRDVGGASKTHRQNAGIAQGCPLSPYLFVMVMSVLLADVAANLRSEKYTEKSPYIVTEDVLYADDTLLVATDVKKLQRHLDLIEQAGRSYGLELNLAKTVLLKIRHDGELIGSSGSPVRASDTAVYLGGLISVDGRPVSEVSRRLGEAGRLFETLSAVWKHANLTRMQKQRVFERCVITKLLYGLESLWLLKADRDKIDSFYARCMRRIYGVAPSFISRLSNQ